MSLLESPEIWNSVPLEDLLIYVIGGDWGTAPDYQEQGYQTVACIRGSEFRHWTKESGRTAVTRKVKANSLDKRALLPGDILLEISGGGPDQPVGRTVLINRAVLNQFDTPVIGTNFLRLLRPSAALDQRFLNQYLEFFYSSGEVVRYQGGSNNLRNLKFKEYSQISVPLPPLAEQKVIADKLDTLLAQVENTKARLERIPQILKRFRQSVLAAAVSGRLTDEWRKKQSFGRVSVAKIKQDHRDSDIFKAKRYFEPARFQENNVAYQIPESWEWFRAEELCDLITKGTTPKKADMSGSNDVPFIKVYNLTFDGTLDFSIEPTFISKDIHENVLKRSKTYPGDVLMNIVGPPLGKVSIVPNSFPEWNLNQAISIFRPICGITPSYLALCLRDTTLLEQTKSKAKATAGQFNLTLEICRDYAVPVPPLKEQTEIVRRVDQLFAHADRIEQQVNSALVRVNNLTQSILAKAFRGELTEQWRKNNPELISGENSAEALLERIKTERAAAKPAKKTHKQTTA